jgi:hypothetical protein
MNQGRLFKNKSGFAALVAGLVPDARASNRASGHTHARYGGPRGLVGRCRRAYHPDRGQD